MKKSQFTIASKFAGKKAPFNLGVIKDGFIYFSDGSNTSAVKINQEGSNGNVSINDLKKVYSRGEIDRFDISGTQASLNIGQKQFKFHSIPDIELIMPEVKIDACVAFFFNVDTELLNAKKYIAKDDLRPAMGGLHFSFVNMEAVTTDAHRLYFIKTDFSVGYDIVLDKAVFNIPTGRYIVEDMKYHVLFRNDDTRFYIAKIDERYPNYKAVIPQSFEDRYQYDKKELKELLQDALICANKLTNTIKLSDNGELFAEDLDNCAEFKGTANKFKSNNRVDRIGVNGKFLLEIIDMYDVNEIHIDITSANRAMIVNDNCLLMPVMLND